MADSYPIEILIQRYLAGQASSEEILQVEKRLVIDTAFKKMFDLIKQEQIVLESLVETETKSYVHDWFVSQKVTNPKPIKSSRWAWIFSFTILTLLTYLYLHKKTEVVPSAVQPLSLKVDSTSKQVDTINASPTNPKNQIPEKNAIPADEQLSNKNLEDVALASYELPLDEGALRGNADENQINMIWQNLRLKQYNQANNQLDSLSQISGDEKKYLLAHLYMGQRKYNQALKEFNLLKNAAQYKDDAQWYIILGTLAKGKKSYTEARTLVDAIMLDTSHPRWEEALILKRKLIGK